MMINNQMAKSFLFLTIIMAVVLMLQPARPDPQINLLNEGCSLYDANNPRDFFNNLNATFADLRRQLSSSNKHFATAQHSLYGMIQCRNYLSSADCIACYNAAVSQIRNCSAANGGRVINDGCFLRYESSNFYAQSTLPGNGQTCGNRTAPQAASFVADAEALLKDLEVAAPRIGGYFAAAKRVMTHGTETIYALAQCAETISESGCEECLTVAYDNIRICLNNTDGRAFDAGCFMRYSNKPFFSDNQTINITPYLKGGSKSKTRNIFGGVAGGVGLLILLLLALFIWYRLSRKPRKPHRGNILGATELQGPLLYKYKDLKDATKHFSEENKLGEGGFGEVYKGTLKNGNIVAVKKLSVSSSRVKAEFDSEVRLISNVHHRNLIRLLGCSTRGADLLLVYEYMENGSLDRFLYGEERDTLNWKQRHTIIFGTARGLAYLHEQFHVSIIHRDIKSSNILLDKDFQPKIADFGLARLMPQDQSHLSTKFAGTLGYTAPEYAIHGHLSEKVDIYSFGVVVLEIVSGRRSSDVNDESSNDYLLEQAWKLHESNMHLNLVDKTLDSNEYNPEEVKKVIMVALSCTQSPASLRPTMSEVVVMLSSDWSLEQRPPRRPAFIDSDKITLLNSSTSTSSAKSGATASFTDFTGR